MIAMPARPGVLLRCMAMLPLSLLTTAALAQATCPDAANVSAAELHGHWQAALTAHAAGPAQVWQLELGPHPDYPGSLRGVLVQGTVRRPVAADLDDGEFTMEESHDGVHISATWLGEVVEGSCAQMLRGVRQGSSDSAAQQAFVLQRHRPR